MTPVSNIVYVFASAWLGAVVGRWFGRNNWNHFLGLLVALTGSLGIYFSLKFLEATLWSFQ